MLDFPLWKRIVVWAITIAVAALSIPSIVSVMGIPAGG